MPFDLSSLLLLGGAFAVAVGGVLGVYRLVTVRRRAVAERMQTVQAIQSQVATVEGAVPAASRFRAVESALKHSTLARRLERRLTTAGIALRLPEFLIIVIATTVVGAIVGAAGLRSVTIGGILGLAGFYFPNALVGWCESRRKALLERQLAAALRLVAASMQAGHAFQTALATAAEQLPDPIATEFDRVVAQVNRGLSLEVALAQLSDRINSYDYELFVNAVTVQLRTGGRLSEILDNIAATIRQRAALQREVGAASAQGKLSGGVLIAIPMFIAGALLLINRQYAMLLFTDPTGQAMVKAALIMQAVGILVIRRMLRIRV